MKEYLDLCLMGESSIPQRKIILERLMASMKELQECIDYIDWKESFYSDVLSGKTKYFSYLLPEYDK